jgi:hypothetical protein
VQKGGSAISYLAEILAMKKPPKKKPAEPPKAEVVREVVPFPQGEALVTAKAERTKAISRALSEAEQRERGRIRRAEALVNSEAYAAAAERFNAAQARERSENWFDPTQPFGFRR